MRAEGKHCYRRVRPRRVPELEQELADGRVEEGQKRPHLRFVVGRGQSAREPSVVGVEGSGQRGRQCFEDESC